jgi:hypothetical protein
MHRASDDPLEVMEATFSQYFGEHAATCLCPHSRTAG